MENCLGLCELFTQYVLRILEFSNPRLHEIFVYNLGVMLGGTRKIAELQESGRKLTKPRIGAAITKLLEVPLNIGSKYYL